MHFAQADSSAPVTDATQHVRIRDTSGYCVCVRILIAEDSQVSRAVLEQQLRSMGYEAEIVQNGTEAWERLRQDDGPELALLDWMLPGLEGVEVCRRVREHHSDRYRYLILVTMKERTEDIAEGLAAGADDFIVKPFDPMELRARVRVGERVLRYAERLRRANDDLVRLATTDELSRLYNRGAILDRLDQEFNRHLRERRPISVLMVDIDSLKDVNDQHGHAAGDAAIRHAADAIQSACRIYDVVGRYGGDEFLVALPGASSDAAMVVAERIRSKMGAVIVGDDRFELSASIGVASWTSDSTHTPQATIRAADSALLHAKRDGRDRSLIATEADYASAATVPTIDSGAG